MCEKPFWHQPDSKTDGRDAGRLVLPLYIHECTDNLSALLTISRQAWNELHEKTHRPNIRTPRHALQHCIACILHSMNERMGLRPHQISSREPHEKLGQASTYLRCGASAWQ